MTAKSVPPEIADRPSEKDLAQCVRCGYCLQECPTYLQVALETDSPRGRIYLIRAMADGRVEATPSLVNRRHRYHRFFY